MNRKLTLKIKRRSQPGWLCWLLIVLPFLFGTLGFPGSLRYTMDAAWFALLVVMLVYRKSIWWRNLSGLILWVTGFLLFSALAYLPQYQSGLYYLWGVRNNFRYYAAFFAFCVFLSGSDVEGYFRLFDKLFWINLIVSVVQFVFLGKEGDYLGGIFGTQKGGNGYTNIFFCIILTKSIIYYLEKKESLRTCAWKFAAAMVVAAMAELKFFFAEAVLILILAVLFTDFSWRKVLIIAGGLAGVAAGAALLVVIFPDFAGFFTGRWLWNNAVSAAGYTSSGDMNRLNAIGVSNELFLKNGWMRLFGMGMGNCETSAFAFLNSPFFERFGALHYTWMSHAMMYLECGWTGLAFYFGFFLLVYFRAGKIERTGGRRIKSHCLIARMMAVLCMVIAIYNSSMRTEAGYMAYFVLAVPFAVCRDKDSTET